MQSEDPTNHSRLSQKQKEQWRGYVTSKLENAEKKEEAKKPVLEDQERVERWLEEVNDTDDGYETVQVTKHMFVKQKKNDQQNIHEIVEKHPYKKWEEINKG